MADYSRKHPVGTPPDPVVAGALTARAADGRITCATALKLAGDLGVPPSLVGDTADLLEIRIVACQMGLFGYKPHKKIVVPASEVPEYLRRAIETAVADGAIDCASCLGVAEALSLQPMDVSAACEHLELKIVRCQIGAF